MCKLYLDLDGLGSDWQGYVLKKLPFLNGDIEILNQHPERSAIVTKLYREDPRLFYCLAKIDKYQHLINFAKEHFEEWAILTAGAVEHPSHSTVVRDKRLWCADMFEIPEDKCIVLRKSAAKARYAKGNILVDDFMKNCKEWEKAGGTAIHATTLIYDVNTVINQIKAAM